MNELLTRGLQAWVALVLISASPVLGQSAPVVSTVSASQRPDDSKMVDIRYDLDDDSLCTVWVRISGDGGVSWNVPAQTFLPGSAIGPNVIPGTNKSIVWDAGADMPGIIGNFNVRVYADDGNGQAKMVFVPGGSYHNGDSVWVYVPAFWIDKFEVTNARYCEFLNLADPAGEHWDASMEISRSGNAPNVIYSVDHDRQNFPIRFAGSVDASAFASWLSEREGRTYRLPTSDEWRKAAGWDPEEEHFYQYAFHQDTINCSWCNYGGCVGSVTEVGHYNGSEETNNAQSYYGCYDMSGNVYERMPNGTVHGGSFMNAATSARIGGGGAFTAERVAWAGFRIVLEP